ncbi:MAG: cytochrome c biogenesis protein [Microscillaceae bacterium]|jgi:heme exporter protein C|nr:cytochrome c biogenesis protein [Microscillaceae bacterium]
MKWWKIMTIILLFYTLIGGFLLPVPRLAIVNESIRNLYFHVPMWFGMIIILAISVYYALRYLRQPTELNDLYAVESANVGILLGILGIVTGMVWAQYTWGTYWHGDPKQNASAIALLIYLAYSVLRNSLEDAQQRAKVSAVYNVFAFATLIPLLFILPRLTDSMHPGNGGNPGFNSYDLDSTMRMVFYPAVIAWTLLGWWIVTLRVRWRVLQNRVNENALKVESSLLA